MPTARHAASTTGFQPIPTPYAYQACPHLIHAVTRRGFATTVSAIREAQHVSQPVFARYLNVSKNLVSDWERGKKRPGGPALRLLSIIQRKGLEAVA